MTYEPKPLEEISRPNSAADFIQIYMYRLSGFLGMVMLLVMWALIFSRQEKLGRFTVDEMAAYIIIGSIINLFSSFFLQKVIAQDVYGRQSNFLVYNPFRYFYHIIVKRAGSNFFPFASALCLHAIALYFLLPGFKFNFDPIALAVIAAMMVLAFFFEFLLVYLFKMFVFWEMEKGYSYRLVVHLRRFFSGNYIPLSLLPPVFFQVSMSLPFAYSFFVPTELYLKKLDIDLGFQGLFVQSVWIVMLYLLILLVRTRRANRGRIGIEELKKD